MFQSEAKILITSADIVIVAKRGTKFQTQQSDRQKIDDMSR